VGTLCLRPICVLEMGVMLRKSGICTPSVWLTLSKLVKVSVLVCCLLMVSAIPIFAQDADGDGVPDAKDEAPTDSTRVVLDSNIPDALFAVSENMVMWLNAASENAVSTDSVGITAWYDFSGTGNHVLQATDANKPTLSVNAQNSLSTIKFDGINDYLDVADNASLDLNQHTAFVVFQTNDPTKAGDQHLIAKYKFLLSQRAYQYVIIDSGKMLGGISEAGTADDAVFGSTSIDTSYHLTGGRYDQVDLDVHFDGPVDGTIARTFTVFDSSSSLQIGARLQNNSALDNVLTGNIAEVIMFDVALSDAQRFAINFYLSEKWGLTATVDSDGDGFVDSEDTTPTENTGDADADGVPDAQDDFPTDNTQARIVTVPNAISPVLSNLQLWLDASASENFVLTGLKIETWIDLSGQGHNAIQDVSNDQPTLATSNLNTNRIVDFDSSATEFLELDQHVGDFQSISSGSVFIVARTTPSDNNASFMAVSDTADVGNDVLFQVQDLGTSMELFVREGGGLINVKAPLVAGDWFLGLFEVDTVADGDGDKARVFSNGVRGEGSTTQAFFNSVNNLNSMRIGNNQDSGGNEFHYNGDLAEILLFDRRLSDSETAEVNFYLSQKWGITDVVDSDGDRVIDDDDAGATDNTFVVTLPAMPAAINAVSANVLVWVDSSVTSNLIITENRVKVFADLSGNGRNGFQDTDSQRPTIATGSINSLHALKFDGIDDIFHFSDENFAVQPLAMFVVIKKTSDQSGQRGIVSTDDGAIGGQSIGLNGNTLEIQTHNTDFLTSFSARQGAVTLISALYDGDATSGSGGSASGSRVDVYIDGIRILGQVYTSLILDNVDGLKIGGHEIGSSTYFDGEIGEVLIVDKVLSESERLDIEEYLLDKWGILRHDGLFFGP